MFAIDTNVVVRYLTADDPRQAQRARTIIEAQDVFVPTTVLLETEWVLRSAYGHDRAAVFAALRNFAGLPHVVLEDSQRAVRALDWADQGMDFADALHLSAAEDCDAFLTFDKRMGRAAVAAGASTVREP
jgi:predicted nucleic-acid-binding protein